MILVLEDRYKPPLSNDTRNVQLPTIWRHNDVLMTSELWKWGFTDFHWKQTIFSSFRQKSHGQSPLVGVEADAFKGLKSW